MKPQAHTPTPWKVQVEYGDPGIPRNQGGGEKVYICAADGKKVAKPLREFRGTFTPGTGWEKIERPLPEVKANAAFIVRAVNSHEELLGLVKSLVGALPYGYATLEREANAAIAKAEAPQ